MKKYVILAAIAALVVIAIFAIRRESADVPSTAPGVATHSGARKDFTENPADSSARKRRDRDDPDAWLADLEALAGRDPQAALKKLPPESDPDSRSEGIAAIGTGWARRDPQAAAAWAAGLENEDDASDAVAGVVPEWAEAAPADCLAWAKSLPEGNLRDDAMLELADAWSAADPAAAFAEFLALKDEDALDVVASTWAVDAPQEAIGEIAALPDPELRDQLMQAALAGLADDDPQLAWTEAAQMSDPEYVEDVRSMALETLAATDPRTAIALAETAGSTEAMLGGIARGWADSDLPAARKWLAEMPDRELAGRLAEEISDYDEDE